MSEELEIPLKERLILIEFWTEWCESCKLLEPSISEIAEEYKNRIIVWKVNAEKNRELAALYRIENIPTIIFAFGSDIIDREVGSITKKQLKEKIDSIIQTRKNNERS